MVDVDVVDVDVVDVDVVDLRVLLPIGGRDGYNLGLDGYLELQM